MFIRFVFLDSPIIDPTAYASVTVEGKQPVALKEIYGAILLMRMVLGENPIKSPGKRPLPIYTRDLHRLFGEGKGSRRQIDRATSDLRNTLGKNSPPGVYRMFVERKDSKRRDASSSYYLELGNREVGIDFIDLVNLLDQADKSEWNWTRVRQTIQNWNDLYSTDFIGKLDERSRVENLDELPCVQWAITQHKYIWQKLSAIFDKYVLCLMAQNELLRAEEFVRDEWLGKLDLIYQPIQGKPLLDDIRVWPHFRMMQILSWRAGGQSRAQAHFDRYKGRFDDHTPFHFLLPRFMEQIRNKGFGRHPDSIDDLRRLFSSENFDTEVGTWIEQNNLMLNLINVPPHLKNLDSKRPIALGSNQDQYKLSQPISVPSLSVSERNDLLGKIENAIRRYFGDVDWHKPQRVQKRLDLNCQLTFTDSLGRHVETLTSREVPNRFIENWDWLLILGELGSGKSYLLYEIAEDLLKIARASTDAKVPIPLSLVTWNPKRHDSFASWVKHSMMQELTSYKEADDWVDEGRVILLLDGLDEVTPANRGTFIADLERYLLTERASDAQCVITCRQQEYWQGPAFGIRFYQITIKPLTDEQIDDFLSKKG